MGSGTEHLVTELENQSLPAITIGHKNTERDYELQYIRQVARQAHPDENSYAILEDLTRQGLETNWWNHRCNTGPFQCMMTAVTEWCVFHSVSRHLRGVAGTIDADTTLMAGECTETCRERIHNSPDPR